LGRPYLRDLIDTTHVYLKMMEKFCQGSIVVQTKVRNSKAKKKKSQQKSKKSNKPTKEQVSVSESFRVPFPFKIKQMECFLLPPGKVRARMGRASFCKSLDCAGEQRQLAGGGASVAL